ncbi:MAG: PAS domain S-box protein [Methanomicrobiales archaeon]
MAAGRILILGSEGSDVTELQSKLISWGYDVVYFIFNENKAIKKCKEIMPDIVLMDVASEGRLQGIKKAEEFITNFKIPILFLTSTDRKESLKSTKMGETGYLLKPFDDYDLKNTVKIALEKSNIEKKLKKTEKYLKLISDNMNDYIGQVDKNGIIEYVSPSVKKTVGYYPKEIIGKQFFEFLHPGDLKISLKTFKDCMEFNRKINLQNRFKHYNGVYIWIETMFNPLMDSSGHIIGAVFSTRDINQRKIIENELKEIKNRFNRITYSMNDLITEIDSKGNHIYVSPSFEKVLGYKPKDLIGKSIFSFVHPDDRASLIKTFKTLTGLGKPGKSINRLKNASGNYLWVESIGIPYLDENRNFSGGLLTARDVTERKKMEDILEFHSQITENLASGVIVVRVKDSVIIYTNEKFDSLFGYDKNELLGLNVGILTEDYVLGDSNSTYQTVFDKLKIEENWHGELKNLKKNGKTFCSHVVISTLDSPEHGKVWIGVHEDISERKKMEKDLHKASEYARNLIETSLDPMVTISPIGKITDVNKATEKATGFNRENLIGTDFSEYFTDPEKAKMGYQKALFYGSLQDYPLTIRHRSGSIKQVLYNATVYRNDIGEVEGVFAAARDIAKLKKAKKALKNSERYYRSLIENALEVIFVLDEEGNINYASPSIKSVFGYEVQEIIGFNIFDFIHPEELENTLDVFFRELENIDSNMRLTMRFQHEDGSWRYCIMVAQNLINDPAVKGVVINARDITERKIAEDTLKQKDQRLKYITSNMLDIVGQIDCKGVFRYISPSLERVLGYKIEKFLDKPLKNFFQLIHPEDLGIINNNLKNLSKINEPGKLSLRFLHSEGSYVGLEIVYNPIYDKKNLNGFIFNIREFK